MRFFSIVLFLVGTLSLSGQDKKAKPIFHEVSNKEVVQSVYPNAVKVDKVNDVWFQIKDENNKLLGYAMSSAPYCKDIIGYNDATPVLIITDQNLIIKKIALLSNSETAGYVNKLTRKGFFNLWNEHSLKEAQTVELDGYTGATYTAEAVGKNVDFMLKKGLKKLPTKRAK